MNKYLILNFKTYTEASGEEALKLAEIVAEASKNTDINLTICPQAADIYRIREKFPMMSIWSQHIDPIQPGRNTGWTSPTTIVMAGATGTLINHSEKKQGVVEIENSVKIGKQLQLSTCVAVNSVDLALKVSTSNPDFIAYEPEELISTGVSLIDSDKGLAEDFITKLKSSSSKLILGAGVKNANDIRQATAIGYHGVLLASGFINAENKLSYLQELLSGFAD
jgi:triosephosphate isomerase